MLAKLSGHPKTMLAEVILQYFAFYDFIIKLLKKKAIDWIHLGLGLFLASTVFYSIFGTNAEFARTAITALPFMFVAIAIYIDWFCIHIIKKNSLT